jgi:HSP20 family protein
MENIIKRRKSENVGPLGIMRRGFDDLFDDFFNEFGISPYRWGREARMDFVPKMDITESDKEYNLAVELPGMDRKDIEIDLTDDVLTIKGEKKTERKEEGKGRYHFERSYGSFSRSVTLPSNVKDEEIAADFKNGVLHVTLPKAEPAKSHSKKVQIKAE